MSAKGKTDETGAVASTSVTKRRSVLSFKTKLEIIKRAAKGETLSTIARAYSLNRSTISTILKCKSKILERVKSAAGVNSLIFSKRRSVAVEEMELLLKIWIQEQNRLGIGLSNEMIKCKAISLHADRLKILGQCASESIPFTASSGWLHRFKMRNKVTYSKPTGGDDVGGDTFFEELSTIVEKGGYCASQVFNASETVLFWKKMPSRYYVATEEEKSPESEKLKDRLSLMFCANAVGDCKLKPLLVYLSENPRALAGRDKRALPVIWKSDQNIRITATIFREWFVEHFVPEVKEYCRKNDLAFKVLLVLNKAHCYPTILGDLNPSVQVVILPQKIAPLLQPLDHTITTIFKRYYLGCAMVQSIESTSGPRALTSKEFWRGFNILHAIRNIAQSWAGINKSAINQCWNKLCPDLVLGFLNFEGTPEQIMTEVSGMGMTLDLEKDADNVEELDVCHSQESHNRNVTKEYKCHLADKTLQLGDCYTTSSIPTKTFSSDVVCEALKKINEGLSLLVNNDPDEGRSSAVIEAVLKDVSCYRVLCKEKGS